ncbi:MAG: hypothetical protein AAFU85_24870 [Planctomycetota bacterium]
MRCMLLFLFILLGSTPKLAHATRNVFLLYVSDHLDPEQLARMNPLGAEPGMYVDYKNLRTFFNNRGLFPYRRTWFVGGRDGLTGSRANGQTILDLIRDTNYGRNGVSESDVFVFCSSSHGSWDPNAGHVLDFRRPNAAIRRQAILDAIRNQGFRNIVMLTNACAGVALPPQHGIPAMGAADQFPEPITVQDLIFNANGITDINASRPGEYAYVSATVPGSNFFNSFFESLLLPRQLVDRDGDGITRWNEFGDQMQQISEDDFAQLKRLSVRPINQANHQFGVNGLAGSRSPIPIQPIPGLGLSISGFDGRGARVTEVRSNSAAHFAFSKVRTPFFLKSASYDVRLDAECVCETNRTVRLVNQNAMDQVIRDIQAGDVNSTWITFRFVDPQFPNQGTLKQPVKANLVVPDPIGIP